MLIQEFIQTGESAWAEFEALIEKARKRSLKGLSAIELDRLAWLYRSVTNDLAKARALFPGTDLEERLNTLAGHGYTFIYGRRTRDGSRAGTFLTRDFPACARRNFVFIAVSAAILILFSAAGLFVHKIDPRLPTTVIPEKMMDNFKSELQTKGRVDRDIKFEDRSVFSSLLIVNNIKVSFAAFALGVFFGIGTIYILAMNGLMIGALGIVFAQRHSLLNYLAFILPHGVVEIAAIVVSGAAGLMLGYSLLNPGEHTRPESVRRAAGEAVELMLGVAAMLALAGFIEAFITPIMWFPDAAKVAFSAVLFVLMILYFMRAGLRAADRPVRRRGSIRKIARTSARDISLPKQR
jgi:uncharacterized membrane protein SpoIIM required for sporulation